MNKDKERIQKIIDSFLSYQKNDIALAIIADKKASYVKRIVKPFTLVQDKSGFVYRVDSIIKKKS